MSKVFLLREKDFEDLLTRIDRDPQHGSEGGSSAVLTENEKRAFDQAHRFYNFHVRRWISEMREEKK